MEYQYHILNQCAVQGIKQALESFILQKEKPIFVCIGSDLAIGDSLGPLCGSILQTKLQDYFVYGCLKKPITAKEIQYLNDFFKNVHPNAPIIAIDAAVGKESDIGLIKIINGGIHPGSGVNKKLDSVGTVSIMGIVAARSPLNFSILHAPRLNLIYTMSNIIAEAIVQFSNSQSSTSKTIAYFRQCTEKNKYLPTNPQ